MKLSASIDGDLRRILADELTLAEAAITDGMRDAAEGLKAELRQQVAAAGLGPRLANTWRSEVYPKGRASLRAAGFVFSKAPDIVAAFEDGTVIRSTKGFWLAIPTPAAGTGAGGKRIDPGLWERMHGSRLRFVYRRSGVSLLVADAMRARAGLGGDVHSGAAGYPAQTPGCRRRRREMGRCGSGAGDQELAGSWLMTGCRPATV